MRKIYSLLLLGGLLLFGAESAMATKTIYFLNTGNWSGTIHCHNWGDGAGTTTWPGTDMTFVDYFSGYALYKVDVPDGRTLCIFNNDPSSDRIDNVDIDGKDGQIFIPNTSSWHTYSNLEVGWKLWIKAGTGSFVGYELKKAKSSDTYSSASVTISADDYEKVQEFYIQNMYGNAFYCKCSSSIYYSVTDWSFSDGADNCTLYPSKAGSYKFDLAWDGTTPKISVTYPAGNNTYTVAYDNEWSWGSVYLYAWIGDGNSSFPDKKEPFGEFPGVQVTAGADGLFTKTFTADVAPDYIVWNIGGSSDKTPDLDFVNNAVYDWTNGQIKYDNIQPTKVSGKNYATFFSPYKTEIPATVTAYTGDLVGYDLKLYAVSNQIIPANTPVVLKASSDSKFNITATTKAAGTISDEDNDLVGTDEVKDVDDVDVPVGGSLCVLGVSGSDVGFFTFTGDELAANKAYLIVPAGGGTAPSAIRIIDEAENTTNIQSVEANESAVKFIKNGQLLIKKNGITYDMTGRMVE